MQSLIAIHGVSRIVKNREEIRDKPLRLLPLVASTSPFRRGFITRQQLLTPNS